MLQVTEISNPPYLRGFGIERASVNREVLLV